MKINSALLSVIIANFQSLCVRDLHRASRICSMTYFRVMTRVWRTWQTISEDGSFTQGLPNVKFPSTMVRWVTSKSELCPPFLFPQRNREKRPLPKGLVLSETPTRLLVDHEDQLPSSTWPRYWRYSGSLVSSGAAPLGEHLDHAIVGPKVDPMSLSPIARVQMHVGECFDEGFLMDIQRWRPDMARKCEIIQRNIACARTTEVLLIPRLNVEHWIIAMGHGLLSKPLPTALLYQSVPAWRFHQSSVWNFRFTMILHMCAFYHNSGYHTLLSNRPSF